MEVSDRQKVILQAAMTAPGAFKPKYIVEKTGLAYNTVGTQLDRLVQKIYLLKTNRLGPTRFLKELGSSGQWLLLKTKRG